MGILITFFNGSAGGRMKYFRHLTSGMDGDRLQPIYAKFGFHKGYALYFMLLEVCARRYNGLQEEFKFESVYLAKVLQIRRRNLVEVLQEFSRNFLLTELLIDSKSTLIQFRIPDLINISDDYARKVRTNSGQESAKGSPKNKKKNKKENIIVVEPTTTDESFKENKFYKRLSAEIRSAIEETYPADFLNRAIIDVTGYLESTGYQHISRLDAFLPGNLHDKWVYLEKKKTDKPQQQKKSVNGFAAEF